MNENEKNEIGTGGEIGSERISDGGGSEGAVIRKPPMKERLENFWYHYKWHTLVAIFLVITLTVCSLQMCQKTSYDIYITYAGYYEIERNGSGGSSPYNEAVTSLSRLAEDFDGDGKINVNLQTLFVVNEAEKSALLKENENYEINETLVREDSETLQTALVFGEHYICLLSERLYKEYDSTFEGELFISLSEYKNASGEAVFLGENETGVYLNSLAISGLPVLCDLPDDTVLCVRKLSEVSQTFGKAKNEENYKRSIEMLENIFSYN